MLRPRRSSRTPRRSNDCVHGSRSSWRRPEMISAPRRDTLGDGDPDPSLERSGPFWDAVFGRIPLPPAAATLGLALVDADVERRTIELRFTATEAFTNPSGNVLGGFLAAML